MENIDFRVEIITPPIADETDLVEGALVTLTQAICRATGEETGFGLGGRFGYGEDYENDVFVMRRFYWGDCDCGWDDLESEWCDSHHHAENCYRSELEREKIAAGWTRNRYGYLDKPDQRYDFWRAKEDAIYRRLCKKYGLSYPNGCAVHCTCDHGKEWKEFLASDLGGHKEACSLELPNFRHKRTGFEVRWYKWIGRDTEIKGGGCVDLNAMFNECLASLPGPSVQR